MAAFERFVEFVTFSEQECGSILVSHSNRTPFFQAFCGTREYPFMLLPATVDPTRNKSLVMGHIANHFIRFHR